MQNKLQTEGTPAASIKVAHWYAVKEGDATMTPKDKMLVT